MKQLKINPDFANLLPPLTDEEYSGLEADIIANGCRDALITSNDTLIDGHNRKRICDDHDIEYTTVEMSFASDNAAKLWIWKNQGNRRNMTPLAKIELAAKMKLILEAEAKERQRQAGGDRKSEVYKKEKSGKEILPEPISGKQVRDELAEQAGVSGRTYDKGVYVLEHADEETKDKLRRGEKGVSISGVYNDLKTQETQAESPVEEESTAEEKPFVPDPSSTTPNVPRTMLKPEERTEVDSTLFPRNRITLRDVSKDDPDPLIGALMMNFDENYIEQLMVGLVTTLVQRSKNKLAKRIVKQIKNVTIS